MGTHPIFESDFDCLTERGLTIEMLSRVSRPIAQKLIQKRFGGTFAYFVQKTGNRVWENEHNNFQLRYIVRGVLIGFGLGLGLQIIFGVPEGPYYYDPEQYTPEEYELVQTALGRFLYKYWFTSLRVGHWNTCAGLRFGDENQSRDIGTRRAQNRHANRIGRPKFRTILPRRGGRRHQRSTRWIALDITPSAQRNDPIRR